MLLELILELARVGHDGGRRIRHFGPCYVVRSG
jgi:hypothetical protein